MVNPNPNLTLTRHALQLCRQGVASLQSLQRYHSMDASAAASLLTLTLTQLPAAAEGGVGGGMGGGMGGGLGGLGGAADADAVVSSLTLVSCRVRRSSVRPRRRARCSLTEPKSTPSPSPFPPSPHAHPHPPTLTQTRSLALAQSLAQALTLHLPRTARGCT